jgi:hypothetical protein
MRAQFVRGEDPMDAMKLGDVKGRKLKKISEILLEKFENLFEDKKHKPKIEVEFREVNMGFGNRDQMETDQINISTEYKGYYFALGWLGNPLDTGIAQKFSAKWSQLPRGAGDMKMFQVSNGAFLQLSEWMKSI